MKKVISSVSTSAKDIIYTSTEGEIDCFEGEILNF